MCYYITAVLPPGTTVLDVQPIAEKHGRKFSPITNSGVQDVLHSGELYCLTTAGHCDCDTSIGLVGRKRRPHASAMDEKAKKLVARGWSKAKIERSLTQSSHAQERAAKRDDQSARMGTESWNSLVSDVHLSGIKYLCLLLHFYDGALTQNLQLKGREVIRSEAERREVLPRLSEDVFYEFRADA
jgi:hypothetical protein